MSFKNQNGKKQENRFWRKILLRKKEVTQPEKKKLRGRTRVTYGICDTPFGESLAGISEEGICHVSFFRGDARAHAERFRRVWTNAENRRDDEALAGTFGKIFVPGEKERLAVLLTGTPFQLRVWEKLLEVEEGRTLSYSGLADSIGKPGSARAVANAVANNPVAYIVPCHRIVGKAGNLCGYRWGKDVKRAILESEGASLEFP